MSDYRHYLFFSERIEAGRLQLDMSETWHAAAVLRRKRGDPFLATDGRGAVFECRVESLDKKHMVGLILDSRVVPRHGCRLHLFAGIPERGAFEELLSSLTALGVERITPVVCRYCQGTWWERDADGERLSDRLKKKMIVAMKQSLYPYLPRLDQPVNFNEVCSMVSGHSIVADIGGISAAEIISMNPGTDRYSCFVGPPGGFAHEELAMLKSTGAAVVRIAPTRLTTELAAVVLCSQVIGALRTSPLRTPFTGPAA